MKKIVFLFCFTAFFLACSDNDGVPKGILPKAKMQEVLWDLIRAGEFVDGYIKDTAGSKTNIALDWYDRVYKLHNTTESEFKKSYTYYKEHPALMKEVLDSLGKKQLNQPVDSTAIKPDSANIVKPDSLQEAGRDTLQVKDSNLILPDTVFNKKRLLFGRDKIRALDSIKKARNQIKNQN